MKALLEQVARSQQALGTTLVVGAGAGTSLPGLRALASERLILAEAHGRQAEELARRILPDRGEEVWPLAIVATPTQQATLHILNNPWFNSLKPPTGLAQHYPNLRVINQTAVAARTLAESIDHLALDADREHLLVLDAPGQAGELLSVTAPQALQSFTWIILRCGVAPLYADDNEAQSLLEQLTEAGFDACREDPQSLFPQASFLLVRNQARVDKLLLEALLAEVSAKCETQALLGKQHAKDIERLTRERDRNDTLVKEYRSELDKAAQTSAEQQKITNDYHTQIQKLTKERDDQAKLVAQLQAERDKIAQQAAEQQKLDAVHQAEVDKLTEERNERTVQHKAEWDKAAEQLAELQKLATSRHTQIQKLTQERDNQVLLTSEQAINVRNLTQQLEESKKTSEANAAALASEIEHLRASCDRLQRDLEESRQTASLSVRMQTLREADLKDLQTRYQLALEKNENQYQLLAKLGERLRIAAGYFHQLATPQSSDKDIQAAVHARKLPTSTTPKPMGDRSTTKRIKGKV